MSAIIRVSLTAAQRDILAAKKRFTLIRAGRRFGKTWLALYWLIKMGLTHPGAVCWFVGPDLKQPREVALPALKALLPTGIWIEHKQDMYLAFPNGAKIFFKTCDSMDALRGRAIDFLVCEEFAFWKHSEELWYKILRPQLIDRRGSAMIISSPNGCNTFKRLEEDGRTDAEWSIHHYNIRDNPYLPAAEIAALQASCSDDDWAQEYMAEYLEWSGLIYYEFNPQKHVSGQPHGDIKYTVRGMDWGIADETGCAIIHVLGNDALYVADEYTANNTPIPDICADIKKMPYSPRATIMDSSAWRRESDMQSVAARFHQSGIDLIPGTRDLQTSISDVKMLIKLGKLIVAPRCKNIIRHLQGWNFGEHEPDILAAMRYGLAFLIAKGAVSMPRVPKPAPEIKTNPNGWMSMKEMDAFESKIKERQKPSFTFSVVNPNRGW